MPDRGILSISSGPPRRWQALLCWALILVFFTLYQWGIKVGGADTEAATILARAIWIFGAGLATLGALQEMLARERIEVQDRTLTRHITLLGFELHKTYDLGEMKKLQVVAQAFWEGDTFIVPEGRIAFQYPKKGKPTMLGVAPGLSIPEATRFVAALKEHMLSIGLPVERA